MNIFIMILIGLYLLAFFCALGSSQDRNEVLGVTFFFVIYVPLLSIPLWLAIWLIQRVLE